MGYIERIHGRLVWCWVCVLYFMMGGQKDDCFRRKSLYFVLMTGVYSGKEYMISQIKMTLSWAEERRSFER